MADVTTMGRLLLEDAVPEDVMPPGTVLNKKAVSQVMERLARRYPEQYADILQSMIRISQVAGTEHGGDASIRLKDFRTPPKLRAYREKVKAELSGIAQNPMLSTKSKSEKMVKYMTRIVPKVLDKVKTELKERGGSLGTQLTQGLRGNPLQVAQILFGDMLVTDHKGRPIPIPGITSYSEGLTPAEYWAGTYSSRAGYASVQFATARAGYLGKQMTLAAQRQKVTGEDCGATNVGVSADGDDPDNIGMVLARDVNGLRAGHVVEKKDLPKLKDTEILLRSHLTCQQPEGVCQRCSGKREQGRFPAVGDYVGVTATKAIGEPLAQQLGLSAKHMGTVAKEDQRELEGFDEIEQFLQVPKHFVGGAAIADRDGTVNQIYKAPQGGMYVEISGNQIHVPANQKVTVKKGEKVEAGDSLSNGMPNPADIAKYKGLGAGRLYFAKQFGKILRDNGVPAHRRNIETLARGFFDRVRVTKPDGLLGYSPDDMVFYSDIQRQWKPRKGSELMKPERAVNRYLEVPLGHYSLGTRITPKVAKDLKKMGYSAVMTHLEDPGFEPAILQLRVIGNHDPDWKTGLVAFDLKRRFLEHARKGSFSPHTTTSYVPGLMDPTKL